MFAYASQPRCKASQLCPSKNKKREMEEKIIDLNRKILENHVEENRPPLEIRDKLDLRYSYGKKVLELYEIRTHYIK